MTDPFPVHVRIGSDRFRTDITAAGHALVADEPAELGGSEQGPGPYELLLSSLGACTAITLRMYADRKGWPLEAVEVRLRHDRVHARDCEDCESQSGQVSILERRITLVGPELTSEQRARLAEIADKCPVHKTLTAEIKIRTHVG